MPERSNNLDELLRKSEPHLRLASAIREFFYRLLPRWSALRQTGESKILRTSYFWLFAVPLLAKLLAFTEPHIVQLPKGFQIHLGLPFSWKFFYFSAVAFSLGSLLYSLGCPRIVRNYKGYSEWAEQGRGDRQIVRELFLLIFRPTVSANRQQAILEHFADTVSADVPRRNELAFPEGTAVLGEIDLQRLFEVRIPDKDLSTAFWYLRDYADEIRPLARLACALLFGAGFMLLAVVVAQNFTYVWRYAF